MASDAIRPLTPLDAPWLSALHGEAFETPWSPQSFADLLASPPVHGWGIDGSLGPGFILVQSAFEQGEILTFQVAKAAQGHGLGQRLLSHAVKSLHTLGASEVFLEVSAERLAAKKLYENQGFKLRGLRKNYYRTRAGRRDAEVWALQF